jgi:hyperosmotically inducible periplasmic protein
MKTLSLFVLAASLWAQQPAPDNTKTNQRDAKTSTPVTAGQQGSAKADRDLAAKIRQSIVADKSLSTYGHNVKIVSINGDVTLRGPVRSEDEKASIQRMAEAQAGATHVINHLDVTPEKPKKSNSATSNTK